MTETAVALVHLNKNTFEMVWRMEPINYEMMIDPMSYHYAVIASATPLIKPDFKDQLGVLVASAT